MYNYKKLNFRIYLFIREKDMKNTTNNVKGSISLKFVESLRYLPSL